MAVAKRLQDDARITESMGNVFIDLGFEPAEARILAMRAEVMWQIERQLKVQGWTQAESALQLGISQPRVSRLIKGEWREFTLDTLLKLALRAGLTPVLQVV